MFVCEYEEYRYSLRTVGKTKKAAENLMRELFKQENGNYRFRFDFEADAMNTFEVRDGLKLIDMEEVK